MSQATLQVDAEGVVLLSGELDFASAPALREQLLVRSLPAGLQSMAQVCGLEDWLQQGAQAPT